MMQLTKLKIFLSILLISWPIDIKKSECIDVQLSGRAFHQWDVWVSVVEIKPDDNTNLNILISTSFAPTRT